jgi:hypothetical protein
MSRKLQRGGYIADFSTTADANQYMLYLPPAADNTAALATSGAISEITTPELKGLQGGSSTKANDKLELNNGFYYSIEGGCAFCSSGTSGGGSSRSAARRRGGLGLELAPFISALALLGARLLADEEIGMFNPTSTGGRRSKARRQ